MTRTAPREPVELAEHARALVQAKPREARELADEALRLARAEHDIEGQVAALHALGFALYALGDPRALRTMGSAIRLGERHGHRERAAHVRRNLAMCLAYAGRARASLREIDAAQASLAGAERARTEVFRIPVYWLAGRGAEAVAGSAPALRALRARGDSAWEARLLYNRAAVLTKLGTAPTRPARISSEHGTSTRRSGSTQRQPTRRSSCARAQFRDGDSRRLSRGA